MKTIAVIMCVYGGDKVEWVRQSLDSVVAQTGHFETNIYLGIDGEISVELEHLLKIYASYFHEVVRNDRSLGLAKTLNRLIDRLGCEEYIFRVDADDINMPNRFEKQINFMDLNPSVSVSGGSIIEFWGEGGAEIKRKYPSSDFAVRKYISKASPLAHPTVCFRADVFHRGLRYPENVFPEDIAFWFKILETGGEISNMDDVLVRFRKNSNTIYRRRKISSAFGEMLIYLRGVYALNGVSFALMFPIIRLFVKLLPEVVFVCAYSKTGRWILNALR